MTPLPPEPPARVAGAYSPWQQTTVRCPYCDEQHAMVRTWTDDATGKVRNQFQCGACWCEWWKDRE